MSLLTGADDDGATTGEVDEETAGAGVPGDIDACVGVITGDAAGSKLDVGMWLGNKLVLGT